MKTNVKYEEAIVMIGAQWPRGSGIRPKPQREIQK